MNTVILMGRFVDDPDISKFKSGQDDGLRAVFTLAVQRDGKDAGADFIRCVAFGKCADFIGEYFRKGQRALVTGSWRTGSYEDKDGTKHYSNDCIVSSIEFADSKKEEDRNEGFEENRSRSRSGRR